MGLLTEEVVSRLATRYKKPEWAFLPQAANGTGSAKTRTADAIAMSLWASRGIELHGFEVKVSRGDWLREKRAPEKADEVARYCDRWWLVVGDDDVVKDGELPVKWGLLVPHGKGLRVAVEAPQCDPVPIDRRFLAGLLRAAQEHLVGPDEVARAQEKAREEAIKELKAQIGGAGDIERVRAELIQERQKREELERAIREFEKKSGVEFARYNLGNIGSAVRALRRNGLERAVMTHDWVIQYLQRELEMIKGDKKEVQAEIRRQKESDEDVGATAGRDG